MAWIRERQTSAGISYSVQWRESGRVQSFTYGPKEKRQAEALRAAIVANDGKLPPGYLASLLGTDTPVRTVRGQILHFVEVNPNAGAGWRSESKRIANRYFPETDLLALMPVDQVKNSDVLLWVQRMKKRKRPVSDKTIRNAQSLLFSAMKLAVSDGDISANPATGTAPRSGTTGLRPALTQQEFATIVSLMPDSYRTLIVTLGRTGMRWSEATALTWAHIHLDRSSPYLDVTQAWKELDVRGTYGIGEPKTQRGTRRIFLDPELATLLEEHRPRKAKKLPFVFLTQYDNPVRLSNFHSRHWRPKVLAAHDAGLLSFVPRIHDLRHAHATWLLEDGQPIARVAARLGHDPAVLMRTYSHLTDRGAAETAEAIGTMFDGVEASPLPDDFTFEAPSERNGRRRGRPARPRRA